jgi:hypothetical protein
MGVRGRIHAPALSATNRVMIIGLSSESVWHINMSVVARWNIQSRLLGVPGAR